MLDITIAVPVIVALVSILKTAGLDSRYAPLVSVLIGTVAFYFFGESVDIKTNLFVGLVSGLSASGLYSGAKTTLKMK